MVEQLSRDNLKPLMGTWHTQGIKDVAGEAQRKQGVATATHRPVAQLVGTLFDGQQHVGAEWDALEEGHQVDLLISQFHL